MKKISLLLLGSLLFVNAMADNKQTITIDGSQIAQTVTQIAFDGDNVILTYSDNSSSLPTDMSLVKIAFEYGTTGISQVNTAEKALVGKVFNLNGQLVGTSTEGLAKGVYIVNGKKMIVK